MDATHGGTWSAGAACMRGLPAFSESESPNRLCHKAHTRRFAARIVQMTRYVLPHQLALFDAPLDRLTDGSPPPAGTRSLRVLADRRHTLCDHPPRSRGQWPREGSSVAGPVQS